MFQYVSRKKTLERITAEWLKQRYEYKTRISHEVHLPVEDEEEEYQNEKVIEIDVFGRKVLSNKEKLAIVECKFPILTSKYEDYSNAAKFASNCEILTAYYRKLSKEEGIPRKLYFYFVVGGKVDESISNLLQKSLSGKGSYILINGTDIQKYFKKNRFQPTETVSPCISNHK